MTLVKTSQKISEQWPVERNWGDDCADTTDLACKRTKWNISLDSVHWHVSVHAVNLTHKTGYYFNVTIREAKLGDSTNIEWRIHQESLDSWHLLFTCSVNVSETETASLSDRALALRSKWLRNKLTWALTVRKSRGKLFFLNSKMTRGKLSSAWPKTELRLGKSRG